MTPRLALIAASLCGSVLGAVAAPTTNEAVPAPETRLQNSGTLSAVGQRHRDGGASTVDLLVDLQPRTAGIELSDRTRPETGRPAAPPIGTRPVAAEEKEAPAPVGGLFGAGAAPAVVKQMSAGANASVGMAAERARESGGAARAGGEAGSARGAEPVPLPLKALIGWLRENRAAIGWLAVASLAVVWGGSMVAARRRT